MVRHGTLFRSDSDLPGRRADHADMTAKPSFGIMTAPQQVGYDDILRVWREADAIPEIDHAWLFDHLLPIGGDPDGPIFEGWTLLVGPRRADRAAAARPAGDQQPVPAAGDAGQDRHDRRRRLRRAARVRHRRRLAAEHPDGAARVRRPRPALPRLRDAVGSLAEACTVIRRLWTEAEPFDFDGTYVQLTGAFGNPKPVQRPHPPIVIGGRAARDAARRRRARRRVEHPGGDIDDAIARSALLDRYCAEIGRDPASITRSIHLRGLLRRPRGHPRGDRRGPRGRVHPRDARAPGAVAGRRGGVGREGDHG